MVVPSGPCWWPTKAMLPWITIWPPPGSSMRERWRMFDEPRGAVSGIG